MSIKITVSDGLTPMLDEIFKLNYGYGLQTLDYAGMKIQKKTRDSMSNQMNNWFQIYKEVKQGKNKGKTTRRIVQLKNYHQLGDRTSHQNLGGKASPSSMKNFVTSYMMPKAMTVIVGGKHPSFTPIKYRDGKVVGTLKRVNAVSDSTHALLRKLNNGNMNEEYKSLHRKKSMKRFGANPAYKNNGFYEKGRNASMGQVRDIMTSKMEALLQKAYYRANSAVFKGSTKRIAT